MPKKNMIKEYVSDSYYHVYSRGINKNDVFLDEDDKNVFCSLLKRYLSSEIIKDDKRRFYSNHHDKIDLLAYVMMLNHFHLLIYQKDDERAIAMFMKSLMTSYGMYFNKKYQRQGPVFQSTYLASRIDSDEYLEHISRYIHLNPDNWETTTDSSIDFYSGRRKASWVKPELILGMFSSFESYIEFLCEYDEEKEIFEFDFEDNN